MHNETKNYKIKLKPLSPIHIGTDEAYEPMNYVIDTDKDGKNYMYVFDEFEFVKGLDERSREDFVKIMDYSSGISLLKLQSFIKNRMALAKKIYYRKILVSKDFEKEYREKTGKIVQNEQDAQEIINKLAVEKTFTSPNLNKAIIPGSSLKGAIATAFWEMKVIDDDQKYEVVKRTMEATDKRNPFFHLLISDSKIIKSSTFVNIAKNIKRNKISKDGLSVAHEIISSESEFEVSLIIKNNAIKIEDIKNACNDHYLPIFESQFNEETDKFTKKELENEFIKKYEKLSLKPGEFLIRVGKHSGARAVTVDGERKISIMQGKDKKPKEAEEETTIWLINKQPFGWLLCEILENK